MKKFLLLLFCITFFSIKSEAAIKVTPTVIEMDTKGARSNYVTSSFNVQGAEDETIRFKIYPEYFKITSQGTMDMLEKTPAQDSLINNIKFVPSEFTLQNGRTQKVRLTVTDFDKLPDGESRLVLFLEDVAAREIVLPSGNRNVTTKLLVKTRVGIPVYLDKGNVTKKGEIDLFKAEQQGEKLVCNMKIISDGNSKIRYSGKAQIIKGRTLIDEKPINNNVVGAKNFLLTNEILPTDKITQDGEYKIRLILNYKDENGKIKNLIKESTVNVIKTKQTTI
ncbi:putative uncharacterized protein [Clostridium sp. CAG:967]|nr:putative uncharacterized protein [Clostridium sp. CAG:967]